MQTGRGRCDASPHDQIEQAALAARRWSTANAFRDQGARAVLLVGHILVRCSALEGRAFCCLRERRCDALQSVLQLDRALERRACFAAGRRLCKLHLQQHQLRALARNEGQAGALRA